MFLENSETTIDTVNELQPYINKAFRPTNEQLSLGEKIIAFYRSTEHQVMVIDGYAGTGKTTLISAFVKFMAANNQSVILLASTGRAGKVLSDKAAFPVETIHKHIYILSIQEIDKIRKTKKLVFGMRPNTLPKEAMIIVDESSMVADHAPRGVFLNFGTGKLLSDLIKYAQKRKIIFVGDSSQLPPVNVAFPPVFNIGYIEKNFGIGVMRFKLTEQKRFAPSSIIHRISTTWRMAIENSTHLPLSISCVNEPDASVIGNQQLFGSKLADQIKKTGIENCIGICFSNKAAYAHSQSVRQVLFPNSSELQKGEILIVTQNNYLHDITNGEHLIIDRLGKHETRAKLGFRDFEGRVKDYGGYRTVRGKLIEEIIYQPEPSLSNEQETELYVDFVKRMKQKGIQEESEQFLKMQMIDSYLNALRAKFGYVITCHRAQGGEWDDVFIDIENSLLMQPPALYLRWAYTAVTRSARRIHFLKKSFIK